MIRTMPLAVAALAVTALIAAAPKPVLADGYGPAFVGADCINRGLTFDGHKDLFLSSLHSPLGFSHVTGPGAAPIAPDDPLLPGDDFAHNLALGALVSPDRLPDEAEAPPLVTGTRIPQPRLTGTSPPSVLNEADGAHHARPDVLDADLVGLFGADSILFQF